MSSNAYDTPLRLDWYESRWLPLYTDAAHIVALLALAFPLQLPPVVRYALVLAVLCSWAWQRVSARARRCRQCIGTWIWFEHSRWERHHGGGVETLFLNGRSVVLPWLISLRFRDEHGRRRFLIILPHSISHKTWRHLQIRLREWAAAAAKDQAPA